MFSNNVIFFACSNEVSGLTQKAFAILQKTAVIYCAARETLELIENGLEENDDEEPKVKFEVAKEDVRAAWDLVQLSIETHKSFKVCTVFV